MGSAISWIGVAATEPDLLLTVLSMQSTGDIENTPGPELSMTNVPGWIVVFENSFAGEMLSDNLVKNTASRFQVVWCSLDENLMQSRASFWNSGVEQWTVEHDAQKAWNHLNVRGELPLAFSAIKARLLRQHLENGGSDASVDYIFDIPIELCESITGFRHDVGEHDFALLEPKVVEH